MSGALVLGGETYPVFKMERYFTPKGCLYVENKSEILKGEKERDNKQKNLPK